MKKLAFFSVLMALCTVMFAGCAEEDTKAPATTPDTSAPADDAGDDAAE